MTRVTRDASLTAIAWNFMLAIKDAKCFVNGYGALKKPPSV
jgi:hypothetical protein